MHLTGAYGSKSRTTLSSPAARTRPGGEVSWQGLNRYQTLDDVVHTGPEGCISLQALIYEICHGLQANLGIRESCMAADLCKLPSTAATSKYRPRGR